MNKMINFLKGLAHKFFNSLTTFLNWWKMFFIKAYGSIYYVIKGLFSWMLSTRSNIWLNFKKFIGIISSFFNKMWGGMSSFWSFLMYLKNIRSNVDSFLENLVLTPFWDSNGEFINSLMEGLDFILSPIFFTFGLLYLVFMDMPIIMPLKFFKKCMVRLFTLIWKSLVFLADFYYFVFDSLYPLLCQGLNHIMENFLIFYWVKLSSKFMSLCISFKQSCKVGLKLVFKFLKFLWNSSFVGGVISVVYSFIYAILMEFGGKSILDSYNSFSLNKLEKFFNFTKKSVEALTVWAKMMVVASGMFAAFLPLKYCLLPKLLGYSFEVLKFIWKAISPFVKSMQWFWELIFYSEYSMKYFSEEYMMEMYDDMFKLLLFVFVILVMMVVSSLLWAYHFKNKTYFSDKYTYYQVCSMSFPLVFILGCCFVVWSLDMYLSLFFKDSEMIGTWILKMLDSSWEFFLGGFYKWFQLQVSLYKVDPFVGMAFELFVMVLLVIYIHMECFFFYIYHLDFKLYKDKSFLYCKKKLLSMSLYYSSLMFLFYKYFLFSLIPLTYTWVQVSMEASSIFKSVPEDTMVDPSELGQWIMVTFFVQLFGNTKMFFYYFTLFLIIFWVLKLVYENSIFGKSFLLKLKKNNMKIYYLVSFVDKCFSMLLKMEYYMELSFKFILNMFFQTGFSLTSLFLFINVLFLFLVFMSFSVMGFLVVAYGVMMMGTWASNLHIKYLTGKYNWLPFVMMGITIFFLSTSMLPSEESWEHVLKLYKHIANFFYNIFEFIFVTLSYNILKKGFFVACWGIMIFQMILPILSHMGAFGFLTWLVLINTLVEMASLILVHFFVTKAWKVDLMTVLVITLVFMCILVVLMKIIPIYKTWTKTKMGGKFKVYVWKFIKLLGKISSIIMNMCSSMVLLVGFLLKMILLLTGILTLSIVVWFYIMYDQLSFNWKPITYFSVCMFFMLMNLSVLIFQIKKASEISMSPLKSLSNKKKMIEVDAMVEEDPLSMKAKKQTPKTKTDLMFLSSESEKELSLLEENKKKVTLEEEGS